MQKCDCTLDARFGTVAVCSRRAFTTSQFNTPSPAANVEPTVNFLDFIGENLEGTVNCYEATDTREANERSPHFDSRRKSMRWSSELWRTGSRFRLSILHVSSHILFFFVEFYHDQLLSGRPALLFPSTDPAELRFTLLYDSRIRYS